MSAPAVAAPAARPGIGRTIARNQWVVGLYLLLAALIAFTFLIKPGYGPADIESLAISVLPIVFAAAAQAVIVIAGGIDLSIGSLMALTNVVAAALMAQSGSSSSSSCSARSSAR